MTQDTSLWVVSHPNDEYYTNIINALSPCSTFGRKNNEANFGKKESVRIIAYGYYLIIICPSATPPLCLIFSGTRYMFFNYCFQLGLSNLAVLGNCSL